MCLYPIEYNHDTKDQIMISGIQDQPPFAFSVFPIIANVRDIVSDVFICYSFTEISYEIPGKMRTRVFAGVEQSLYFNLQLTQTSSVSNGVLIMDTVKDIGTVIVNNFTEYGDNGIHGPVMRFHIPVVLPDEFKGFLIKNKHTAGETAFLEDFIGVDSSSGMETVCREGLHSVIN